MIEITKAYQTEDGQTFPTIEEAQEYELKCLVGAMATGEIVVSDAIHCIVCNAEKVISILKIKPRKTRTVKVKKCKLVQNQCSKP